jgi:hypothetical protein
MAAYARTGGNNKERCETRGYGRLLSRAKAYQLWEETLIWEKAYYKISERTGETPRVIGGGSQLLIAWDNALENRGRGLDKQAR